MPDGQRTLQLTLADASCAQLQGTRHPAVVPHTKVVHRRLSASGSRRFPQVVIQGLFEEA